jgi:integrase
MARRGNNEGSISRRKDGRYMDRYTVQTAGGPKQKTIMGKKGESREDVAGRLADVLSDRNKGLVFDTENLTVGEYLDSWLGSSVQGSVRQSTYDRYEIAVRTHIKPALGRIKLSRLTPAHVAGLYQDRIASGCAPASVNKLHVTLHKALSQAVKWSMIPRNVCDVVNAPRPAQEEMQTLCAAEARRLLETAKEDGDRLEALYVLAVHTGLRQGELLGLKWQDVDLEAAELRVRRTLTTSGGRLLLGEPKTAKARRRIRLTAASTDALHRHRKRQLEERMQRASIWQDNDLVFASENGTLINPTNLRKRSLAPLLQRAGLPRIRFHDLRHTCATLLLGKGVHAKFVQELLGHANISITLDTYSHVLPGMGDHAARAMEKALS